MRRCDGLIPAGHGVVDWILVVLFSECVASVVFKLFYEVHVCVNTGLLRLLERVSANGRVLPRDV